MTIRYFKVGGYVRDQLLGIQSKDIDYAVEAPSYEAMRDDVLARGAKIYVEKPEYLTIRAKHNNEDVDFVLCRKDGDYGDGRRPDSVQPGTIDDDLARRDFTCNAIAMYEDGALYDPHDGVRATRLRVLECVGNANDRFSEDALRILRAIRFCITKGFQINHDIKIALHDPLLVGKLVSVSDERIREELNKCFAHDTKATLKMLSEYPYIMRTCFRPDSGLSLEATLKHR